MADSIGVRELRQYASTYLARVKAGESLTVTERGRPIARLVPVRDGEDDWQTRWIAEGRMRPATLPPSTWGEFEPVSLTDEDGNSILDVLDDLRRDYDEPSRLDS
jgi:prevent-host-death family protein